MIKVITYGTFDLLHEGHINLLKRAKALGDYLIVGVTTENFDLTRGKFDVRQSLMARIEAVKQTGLADEVLPEEYVGQKIDDIKRLNVDIFAIGSDWQGKFDYLNEFCRVVYLPRTEGISSSEIRAQSGMRLGVAGNDPSIYKIISNASFVDGISLSGTYFDSKAVLKKVPDLQIFSGFDELLNSSDGVYIAVKPQRRFGFIKRALCAGKHVICESPIALKTAEADELFAFAEENKVVLFDSVKTAYSVAFSRLVSLVKSGIIGEVKAIDVTCTSLELTEWLKKTGYYTSFTGWGAIALLPVFKILGVNYKKIYGDSLSGDGMKDIYTKLNIVYDNALATVNVGVGVKSEGDLRISGTKGYVYVPAPWWQSGYFEVRFEDGKDNKPYFYENAGEGLRTELVHFVNCAATGGKNLYMDGGITRATVALMEKFSKKR